MSPFEFFFTFYGLILGLSVAELLAGLSRTIQARVRVGLLPALLVAFVMVDAATFWNQAWTIFRYAPFNFALLILGLGIAGAFYLAASLVFPREPDENRDLEAHVWTHKRTILLCLLGANLAAGGTMLIVASATGDLALMNLGARFWIGLAIFTVGTLVAALAKGRPVAIGALIVLLLYSGFNIGRAVAQIVDAGGWPIGPRGAALERQAS